MTDSNDQQARGAKRFVFGNFVFDADAALLSSGGVAIELRPKSMEVLAYFLGRPGALITKAELMDAVWGEQAVIAEDSLVQCIVEVRRALDDSARSLIQTVPRRGYRFTPEVHHEIASVHPQSEPAVGSGGTRWKWEGLAAVLVAAAALAAALIDVDAPISSSVQRIAVADLQVSSEVVSASALLLTESLRLRLDEFSGLSTRALEATTDEGSMPLALDLAQGLGIDWLVTGNVKQTPGAARPEVRLWLWDTSNRSRFTMVVYELPKQGDSASTRRFITVRDAIVDRAMLRLPTHLLGNASQAGFPDQIADFETYALVMSELELERCNPELARMMTPVVQRTPDFMRGWMALAWAHWVDSWACGLGEDALKGAMGAAKKVLALRPDYPSAIKVKTSVLAAQGKLSEALAAAQQAARSSPDVAPLWATVSYLLNYTGRLEESERAMEKALALDPLVLIAETGETPNVFLYVGKWQRFLETQPVFDSPYFNFQRAYAHFRSGNTSGALAITQSDQQTAPSDLYTRFSAALTAIIEGRSGAAAEILRGIVEQREQSGQSDGETTYREAVLFLLADEEVTALERLDLASTQGFVCLECVVRDPFWHPLQESGLLAAWSERWSEEMLGGGR
ncbi:MAG: winged helix-turn-helix domain-containing protein [Pseudomonadota bacterium]